MSRILALDIGDRRIGIAVSDSLRTIASPVEVLTRVGWGPDSRYIAELCRRYETDEVVSGLPLNMDGSEGFQAQKVREFCAQLEKIGLKVYYQDERLTTVTAEQALLEGNMSRTGRKNNVDKVAAAVILRQWLDSQTLNEGDTAMDNFEKDDNIVELIGDDGETVQFEHLATLEYEGESYLVLCEADEGNDEEADVDVYILRIEQDEDGNDIYVDPEDDDLCQNVLDMYLNLLEETGDPEDDD